MTERAKRASELWSSFRKLGDEHRSKVNALVDAYGWRPGIDPLTLPDKYREQMNNLTVEWRHVCDTVLKECYAAELPSHEEEQAFRRDYEDLVVRHCLYFDFGDEEPVVKVRYESA